VTARHRFTPGYVETAWTVERGRGRRRWLTVEALFPSWGTGARIDAVRGDGTALPLTPGAGAIALAGVDHLHLAGPRGGYVVVCLGAAGLRARALRVGRQASAPRPGPTLAIELARGTGFSRAGLRVRIAPAASADEARVVAGSLRG
jgi:hypothetical protein